MDNEKIFRALSSPTRIKILKILTNKEIHLSGLARELSISVPVTSRHIKILENVGLINKRIFGNVYLLTAKTKNLEKALEPFIEESTVEISKKRSLFDALKQVPGVDVKQLGKHQYIKSIDGEEGYYIYEVDGDLPKKPVDQYILDKNITLDLKKLISVKKKKIKIEVKRQK
jgi:DNA-binding transcriptional ArsR family regulator